MATVSRRSPARNIDAYISQFPAEIRERLEQVRAAIRNAAPAAEETISYGIPTFNYEGRYLIYFAGFKKHIGLYPAPKQHPLFREELSRYKGGKGTIQFPHDSPLPIGLVKRIVKLKIREARDRNS